MSTTAGPVASQSRPPQENAPDGYPALAAFQENALNTTVFRRFRNINTLNLLHLQTEMFQLENDIQRRWDEDTEAAQTVEQKRTYKSFAQLVRNSKDDESMKDLLRRLRRLTKEYNEALTLYDQAMGLESPGKKPVEVLKHWLEDHQNPLMDAGRRFLDHTQENNREELVALGSERQKKDILTNFIYDKCAVWNILRDNTLKLKVDTDLERASDIEHDIIFFSKTRIDILVMIVKLSLAVVLLFGAIIVLYFTGSNGARLGLVGVFTVMFCITLLVTTTATRGEMLGATAGYAAVLVVFIGSNISSGT